MFLIFSAVLLFSAVTAVHSKQASAHLATQALCSSACPENEVYDACGAACQRNCCNSQTLINFMCICEAGCICADGYIRDPITNNCILLANCPVAKNATTVRKPPKHEVYSECGAGCQPSCNNPQSAVRCKCISGYVCAPGYVRDPSKNNKCVPINSCPPCPKNYLKNDVTGRCDLQCNRCDDPNQVYEMVCSPGCEPSCQPSPQFCAQVCLETCHCKPGYVKATAMSSTCIKKERCRKLTIFQT